MKKFIYSLILIITLFILPLNVSAAKPKLNKTKVEILCGKTYKLKANQKVTWSSSDSNVATVSSSGKITGKNYGSVVITAINKKGEKRICTVKVKKYKVKSTGKRKYPRTITIHTGGKFYKTYRIYNQVGFGNAYLNQRGCAHSSAAIVMSAYGYKYTPYNIHYGNVKTKCSQRYALRKLGKKPVSPNNRSLSVYSVSQILNNVGITNHPVYKFTDASATKEITDNLNAGRPVLIMCHRKKVKGNKLANSYHFIVLVGIDEKGKAIALNPAGGTVNRSQCTGKYSLTVKQLVERHMWSCTGKEYKTFYFNGAKNYGGYIVIDK